MAAIGQRSHYFQHDGNSRYDNKIVRVRRRFGPIGFAIYWWILEMMFVADDYKLPSDDDMFEAIAYEMQVDVDIREFVKYACSIDLFACDDTRFWSPSLIRRMERINDLTEKRVESARLAGVASGKARRRKSKTRTEANENERPFNDRSTTVQRPMNETRTEANENELTKPNQTKLNQTIKEEEEVKPPQDLNNLDNARACAQVIQRLPMSDGSEYGVTLGRAEEWRPLYPSVNVMQELRSMRGWLLANPQREIAANNAENFIVTWLADRQRTEDKQNSWGRDPPGKG